MNIISHTSGTYIKYINSLNNEITINISLISIQQNEIIPNYTTNSKLKIRPSNLSCDLFVLAIAIQFFLFLICQILPKYCNMK